MSYSLAVRGGDLVPEGSSLAIVWGIDKLKQDLQLWVTERYGNDRFHPGLGSILQDYIGSVISPRTQAEIEATEIAKAKAKALLAEYKRNLA
jgi:phage baseplate assembly protein W